MGVGNELARRRVEHVEMPTAYFRAGQLPQVCVFTGEPADRTVRVSAKSRIGAQWLLLLLGIFPMVLVRVLTIQRATGYVPIQRTGFRDHLHAQAPLRRLAQRLLLAAGVAGLVTLFPLLIYLDTDNRADRLYWSFNIALIVVAIVLLIAAVVAGVVYRQRTKVFLYLDRSGEFLSMAPVSAQFAAAVRALPPPGVTPVHPRAEPHGALFGVQPSGR